MSIPRDFFNKLEKYPAIISSFCSAYKKPCLPQDYQVKKLEIICDEKLIFRWVNGYLTHDNEGTERYIPKIIEWFIDGELALLIVEAKTLLNRLKNGIDNENVKIPAIGSEVNSNQGQRQSKQSEI